MTAPKNLSAFRALVIAARPGQGQGGGRLYSASKIETWPSTDSNFRFNYVTHNALQKIHSKEC
jgi:hypothetical protein